MNTKKLFSAEFITDSLPIGGGLPNESPATVGKDDPRNQPGEPFDSPEAEAADNGVSNLPVVAATVAPADPFDAARLRLSQNFTATVGVKKRLTTVPVRKPSKQDFIRVHPDPAYRLDTAVLELKDENETYLVDPGLWA
jgi:hypothetical protein